MSLGTLVGIDPGRNVAVSVSYDATMITEVRDVARPSGGALPVIAPGFIDAQVNGYQGLSVHSDKLTPDIIITMTSRLAAMGVTTWMPTIITSSEEAIVHALRQIAQARATDPIARAAIPGAHVEGPFISDRDGFRGVHPLEHVRPLDHEEVARWQAASNHVVSLLTVSPHTEDAPEQIARIREAGIVVSIGHTHASPEQVSRAIDAGATVATHLGNGIATTIPRHPNVLWTQLADDRLTAGVIADGHHLPWATLEVMLRAKTPERAFLVSDSTAWAGMPAGTYQRTPTVTVELSESGRLSYVGTELLAGAATPLPLGLMNVLSHTTLGFADALRLVTSTPARIIPRTRPGLGELRVGAPADLVLLEADGDDRGAVAGVVQSGRRVL